MPKRKTCCEMEEVEFSPAPGEPGALLGKSVFTPAPQETQVWAHNVCSHAKVKEVFENREITALEADILIGDHLGPDGVRASVPIMAHPPERKGDLCFQEFLDMCVQEGRHHLKLDFKEIAAVQECLPLVARAAPMLMRHGRAVWINADILPGPGKRDESCPVPKAEFIEAVLKFCPGVPLSLGWRVSVSAEPYTEIDCDTMGQLAREYELQVKAMGCAFCGVVFAVALRLMDGSMERLQGLLTETPGSQILAWTGTGEPPVTPDVVRNVKAAFEKAGLLHRVDFDCQVVAES